MKIKQPKYKTFAKGDVLVTEPEIGFYGIAVVLDEGHSIELPNSSTPSFPMCHIAITPLIFDHRPLIDEIDIASIKPLLFHRMVERDGETTFLRTELMVHIYTIRNVLPLEIIGKIDPELVYQGELPWYPDSKSHKCHWCGNVERLFGREAYINWLRGQ